MTADAEVVEITPPAGRRVVDLDAARAARAEKRDAAPVVILGGKEFELPHELPAGVLVSFGELFASTTAGDGDDPSARADQIATLCSALAEVFGETTWKGLLAEGLTLDEMYLVLEGALAAYGIDLPE